MDKHSRVVENSVQSVQIRGKQHVIGSTFVSTKLDINENISEEQKSNNVSSQMFLNLYQNIRIVLLESFCNMLYFSRKSKCSIQLTILFLIF